MTYPPQPPQQPGQPGPYGQQPDPYGQQPGQYGPEGTAQFSQPQFGGEPPYGGGQPPYTGGEPPKSRKGLIIGVVAAVVVVLAAVGVTGFWKPGFFLAADDGGGGNLPATSAPQTPGSTPPSLPTEGPSTPGVPTPPTSGDGPATSTGPAPTGADAVEIDEVAAEAVRSINERDAELAKSVSCEPENAGDLSELPEDAHAEISGSAYLEDPDKAKVPVHFTAGGSSVDEELQIERHDGRWCVSDG